MLDKHTVIKDFLTEILAVDNDVAATDDCAIEYVVSEDTLCHLCRIISKTDTKRRCEGGCHI